MSDRGEGKIKRTAEEHHFDITLQMDYRKKKDLQGKYAKTRDNYNAEKWFDHEAREKSMELKKFYGVKTYQNPKMSFSILCNECALNIIPPHIM